jgi:hypothetical protein
MMDYHAQKINEKMKKYYIDIRKKQMDEHDFKKMFHMCMCETLKLLFRDKSYVLKTEDNTYKTHRYTIIDLNKKEEEKLFELSFTKKHDYGYFSMISSSYTWKVSHMYYRIYVDTINVNDWISLWSKSLRKRILVYMYKLQANDYTDIQLISFLNRLRNTFDMEINGEKVIEIRPFLSEEKYREKLINKILN